MARALAQVWSPVADAGARWLLLDEPTAALDLAHQHHCMALLRARAVEHGVGVVAVVHDVNLAIRYAHDVLILGRGDCLSGQTDRVLVPESIQHIWGVQCTRVPAADGVPQFLFSGA
ncbi:Hemin import ATP-binding protein HmuV [bioreactor metagenome]|uniref:Hemin import ATP-binding protein HmuV n=1 Tax=bioreactor metagenome TaxID=1076179 RepID=A0A645IGQ0_9ZZZZ